ncbi:MAG: SpoIVB peptidase [Clostridia bacterium]|nr:SpoIVB peptidase [Clostridia bacterium]
MKTIRKTGAVMLSLVAVVMLLTARVSAGERTLIAAGTAFGVRFHTDGVVVAGVPADSGPAAEAGLKRGDVITAINGERVRSAEHFADAVKRSLGQEIALEYRRGEETRTAHVRAVTDESGEYRLGVWVKDSAAGIGTITFIDPETMQFVGLGHGICDAESGALIPLAGGSAEEVTLSGITVGEAGVPGELRGSFCGSKLGKLTKNLATGIYGVLLDVPSGLEKERFPIGSKDDVTEGKAYIFSTVDGEGRAMYEIEISRVERESDARNFIVKITDPRLLDKTGGIVQGMSGSPIIQNGKLVGAVTHVLVNDPARGYGIFIENMLEATA